MVFCFLDKRFEGILDFLLEVPIVRRPELKKLVWGISVFTWNCAFLYFLHGLYEVYSHNNWLNIVNLKPVSKSLLNINETVVLQLDQPFWVFLKEMAKVKKKNKTPEMQICISDSQRW